MTDDDIWVLTEVLCDDLANQIDALAKDKEHLVRMSMFICANFFMKAGWVKREHLGDIGRKTADETKADLLAVLQEIISHIFYDEHPKVRRQREEPAEE